MPLIDVCAALMLLRRTLVGPLRTSLCLHAIAVPRRDVLDGLAVCDLAFPPLFFEGRARRRAADPRPDAVTASVGPRPRGEPRKRVEWFFKAISPLLRSDFAQSTAGRYAARRSHGQFRP
jgi:hypothetical protein